MVFASPEEFNTLTQSSDARHVEKLKLKVDITPNEHLPLPLTLLDVNTPDRHTFELRAKGALAAAAGSGPSPVIGLYRPLGSPTLASTIAGSNPAPTAKDSTKLVYSMIVLSNPVAGADKAYNEWYDHQHVPDVLKIPGFVSGQRFQLIVEETPTIYTLPQYAVEFIFESYDLRATQADIENRLKTGVTRTSPAFDNSSSIVRFYEHTTLRQ
jgi:hypothetical protein